MRKRFSLLALWLTIAAAPLSAGPVTEAEAVGLKGSLIQGGMIWGRVAPGSRVELGAHEVKVGPDGLIAAGFDRDAPAVMPLKICASDGQCEVTELGIEQRKYNVQRIEGVPQKTVTPSASVLARIRKESALIGKARSNYLYRNDFTKPFIWPLIGPVTGVFGSQRVYNGTPGRPHYGVDVAAPTGTRVVAPQ
ncbi:MAG: M23 family metallopeptidase, partial [Spongiibacter sp.]